MASVTTTASNRVISFRSDFPFELTQAATASAILQKRRSGRLLDLLVIAQEYSRRCGLHEGAEKQSISDQLHRGQGIHAGLLNQRSKEIVHQDRTVLLIHDAFVIASQAYQWATLLPKRDELPISRVSFTKTSRVISHLAGPNPSKDQ